MRVRVDNSETVRAAERAAFELLGVLPGRMLNAVKMGAEYELQEKTYQDRTGDLRKSTQGKMDRSSANDVSVRLEMGEEYASYVRRRGYSAIAEAAARTDRQIRDDIDAIGRRVTRG